MFQPRTSALSILKRPSIALSPNNPHNTMRDEVPKMARSVTFKTSGPALQKSQDMTRHDPPDSKSRKNQTLEIPSYRTVKEKVINGFPIGFAHAAPVNQHQAALPEVVNSEDFP